MTLALADYLTNIRIELQDTGSAAWSDADLTQALRNALVEFDDAAPCTAITTKTLASDSREIDLSTVAPLRVTRVWLPWTASEEESEHTPRNFELWPGYVLNIVGGDELDSGDVARIWYEAHNTIDDLDSATATTINDALAPILVTGGAAFAAYQRVRELAEIANVDNDVTQRISAFGFNALNRFRSQLNRIRQRGAGGFVAMSPRRRKRVPRA